MGIQIAGPFSGFYNKTGPLIGRRYMGKNVITGLHYPANKAASVKQLMARQRFTMLTDLMNRLKILIDVGFKSYAKRHTALNAAFAYNSDQLLIFDGSAYVLNFPKLVYSRGNVAIPNCASVQMQTGNVIFSWLPEPQSTYNLLNDKATFLVYNEHKGSCLAQVGVAERSDLSYVLLLPADFLGDMLHCYMNFDAENGKMVGGNVYVGHVLVT